MNEEIIKRLIRLNEGQQRLLDNVLDALAALSASGVELYMSDGNLHALNVTAFRQHMEADDDRYRADYERDGFVSVPYWDTPLVPNYICEMGCNDDLFAVIDPSKIDHDRNLFNH